MVTYDPTRACWVWRAGTLEGTAATEAVAHMLVEMATAQD